MDADYQALLGIPTAIYQNMDAVWTMLLLMVRFTGMFITIPGIGMQERGLVVRGSAIFVLAMVCSASGPRAQLPSEWGMLIGQVFSEMALGFVLGLVPYIVVVGVQTGAQIASTTMGLGMGNVIDPSSGQQHADIARLLGDLVIIYFLMIGGHHAVIYAVSGLGGEIIPGSYVIGAASIDALVLQTSQIFRVGLLVSAPVIVALLLANFVMGLISKAVPAVNIFIISFPLTIAIGLILTYLPLPDLTVFVRHQFGGAEKYILEIVRDATSS